MNIETVIANNISLLKSLGAEIPIELKSRDDKEPGRERKELAENKFFKLLRRYWREQKEIIEERFRWALPVKADYLGDRFWDEENNRLIAELSKLLANSATDGIALFGENVNIGLDYTLSNSEAAEWAKNYSFELVKGINQTTRDAVSKAIQNFIDIPGFTIQDVMSQIPYNDKRALQIAITEVTRAYNKGNQLAGEELKKTYPNVKVIKQWITNNDDRVCVLCGPLDGKEVEINKDFEKGIDGPPRHIGCRCYTSVSTRI